MLTPAIGLGFANDLRPMKGALASPKLGKAALASVAAGGLAVGAGADQYARRNFSEKGSKVTTFSLIGWVPVAGFAGFASLQNSAGTLGWGSPGRYKAGAAVGVTALAVSAGAIASAAVGTPDIAGD